MVWRDWTQNPGAKLLSFVVAVGVWLSVTNRIEFEKTLEFPVEYVNGAPGLTSIDPLPETVQVRVRGKGKFLRYTLRSGICRVDLSGYQIGRNLILFSGEDMVFPDDVDVSRVEVLEPRRAAVDFDETVIRDIAISPTVVGNPDPRYIQVGKTFLSPAKARVKGPRRLVDEIGLLATAEIDIGQKRSTVRKRVGLRSPDSRTVEVTPMTVEVGITIEPLVNEQISGVALATSSGVEMPGLATFRPAQVTVQIEGARSIVEVAAKEMSSLLVVSDAWELGTWQLRFREFRDRDIVFGVERLSSNEGAASGRAATRAASPDSATTGPELLRFEPTELEVVARLPLPRDVNVLSISPDRVLVDVKEVVEELVRAPDGQAP
ncbi:MAG: hypothetical protein DHS20C21_24110 [Gemmatimonadota bacterium]|nr:MAG: hypothetical protein DHS20C21_24110 [Gemmatimonadota bacterium]